MGKRETGQKHSIRIIGGRWRGRRLPVLSHQGLRPSGDRSRETLFNWLAADLPGARCLDMFAGTGSLGFEAASRGASSVLMLEADRAVCESLKESAAMLDADQVKIVQTDAMRYPFAGQTGFDIIFLDPPFNNNLLEIAILAIDDQNLVKNGGLIYLELPTAYPLRIPDSWLLLKQKSVAGVRLHLAQKNASG